MTASKLHQLSGRQFHLQAVGDLRPLRDDLNRHDSPQAAPAGSGLELVVLEAHRLADEGREGERVRLAVGVVVVVCVDVEALPDGVAAVLDAILVAKGQHLRRPRAGLDVQDGLLEEAAVSLQVRGDGGGEGGRFRGLASADRRNRSLQRPCGPQVRFEAG